MANTPLCEVDAEAVRATFPSSKTSPSPLILDLGCGSGRTSELLSQRGYRCLGIDLSPHMLDQFNARRITNAQALRANLVQLGGIAENAADGAVCLFSTLGMIAERSNRREFLRHVRRIVVPEGNFLLHVHHRYADLATLPGTRNLLSSVARTLVQAGPNKQHEFGDAIYRYRGLPDMFLHRFSWREVRNDLVATGWRIKSRDRLSLDGSKLLGAGQRLAIAGGYLINAA